MRECNASDIQGKLMENVSGQFLQTIIEFWMRQNHVFSLFLMDLIPFDLLWTNTDYVESYDFIS